MQDPINPYAAPKHLEPLGKAEMTPEERVRREHIGHEALLQSWGGLYIFGGGLGGLVILLAMLSSIMPAVSRGEFESELVLSLVFGALGLALSVALITTGSALRRFDPKSRISAIVVSILGLFAFPCGTIINSYVLYLLLSQKGQTVFTAEYAEIRRQTPHIKYGMPLGNWIVLTTVAAPIAGFLTWRWLSVR